MNPKLLISEFSLEARATLENLFPKQVEVSLQELVLCSAGREHRTNLVWQFLQIWVRHWPTSTLTTFSRSSVDLTSLAEITLENLKFLNVPLATFVFGVLRIPSGEVTPDSIMSRDQIKAEVIKGCTLWLKLFAAVSDCKQGTCGLLIRPECLMVDSAGNLAVYETKSETWEEACEAVYNDLYAISPIYREDVSPDPGLWWFRNRQERFEALHKLQARYERAAQQTPTLFYVGDRIQTRHGVGVVKRLEILSHPIAYDDGPELTLGQHSRLLLVLEDGHTWCFEDALYAVSQSDFERGECRVIYSGENS